MGLSYDRIETETQVIIRWVRLIPFFLGIFLVVIILLLLISLPEIIRVIMLFVPYAAYMWDTQGIRAEIAEAKARSALTVTGHRFSFRDPHTVIIEKSQVM
jgi:hypothetical protein